MKHKNLAPKIILSEGNDLLPQHKHEVKRALEFIEHKFIKFITKQKITKQKQKVYSPLPQWKLLLLDTPS